MKKIISKHFGFINKLLEKRYKSLLIALVAMIIIPSFFEGNHYQSLIFFFLNSITIFLAINAIQESAKQLYTMSFLAFTVIMINQFGALFLF